MQYWILKSEPDEFSFHQLVTKSCGIWDGVRNYQARNFLKQMKVGDVGLFYHTASERSVVGLMKIVREYFPDPTSKEGDWVAVEVEPIKSLRTIVHLNHFKKDPVLSQSLLVKQSRLSVIPLSDLQFKRVLELADTSL